MGVVIRVLVLAGLLCASLSVAAATPSPTDLSLIVCGQSGQGGVTYVIAPGSGFVQCGLDTSGNELVLQRSSVTLAQIQSASSGSSTPPDGSGVAAGAAIGGAVLGAMAVAFCFRLLRGFVNSSSEG